MWVRRHINYHVQVSVPRYRSVRRISLHTHRLRCVSYSSLLGTLARASNSLPAKPAARLLETARRVRSTHMQCRRIEHGYNNRTCDDHLKCSVFRNTYYIGIVLLSARWGKHVGRPCQQQERLMPRLVSSRCVPTQSTLNPFLITSRICHVPLGISPFQAAPPSSLKTPSHLFYDSVSSSSTHC